MTKDSSDVNKGKPLDGTECHLLSAFETHSDRVSNSLSLCKQNSTELTVPVENSKSSKEEWQNILRKFDGFKHSKHQSPKNSARKLMKQKKPRKLLLEAKKSIDKKLHESPSRNELALMFAKMESKKINK